MYMLYLGIDMYIYMHAITTDEVKAMKKRLEGHGRVWRKKRAGRNVIK